MYRDISLATFIFVVALATSVHSFARLRIAEQKAWVLPYSIHLGESLHLALRQGETCIGSAGLTVSVDENLNLAGELEMRARYGATLIPISATLSAFSNPLRQLVASQTRLKSANMSGEIRTDNVSPITAQLSLTSPTKNVSRSFSLPGPITVDLVQGRLAVTPPAGLGQGISPFEAIQQQLLSDLSFSVTETDEIGAKACREGSDAIDIAPLFEKALRLSEILPFFPHEAMP